MMRSYIHSLWARRIAKIREGKATLTPAEVWAFWLLAAFYAVLNPGYDLHGRPPTPKAVGFVWTRMVRPVFEKCGDRPLFSLQLFVLIANRSWKGALLAGIALVLDVAIWGIAVGTISGERVRYANEIRKRFPQSRFYKVSSSGVILRDWAGKVLSAALPTYSPKQMPQEPVRVFVITPQPGDDSLLTPQFLHLFSRWIVFVRDWSDLPGGWQNFTLHQGVSHAAFRTAAQLEEGWSTFRMLSMLGWAALFLTWNVPSALVAALSAIALYAINLQWDIVPGAALSRFFDEIQKADELALSQLSVAELLQVQQVLRARDLGRPGLDEADNDYLAVYRLAQVAKGIESGHLPNTRFVSKLRQRKGFGYFVVVLGLSMAGQSEANWKVWLVGAVTLASVLISGLVWWFSDAMETELLQDIKLRASDGSANTSPDPAEDRIG